MKISSSKYRNIQEANKILEKRYINEQSRWTYGDQMTGLFGPSATSGTNGTSGTMGTSGTNGTSGTSGKSNQVNVYRDKEQINLVALYTVVGISGEKDKIKINLGNWQTETKCADIQSGNFLFKYNQNDYYSKELAKFAGEKFGCKFPG